MLLPRTTTPDGVRCNTIVKRYPTGRVSIVAANRNIFRIAGYEAARDAKPTRAEVPFLSPEAEAEEKEREYARLERNAIEGDGGLSPAEQARAAGNLARAQRRARAAVRDLALANPMKYFVTLTFDKERVARWDDREVMRVTRNWLDNSVRRHGLAYVLVPERHKDGAIHFHGFFNDAFCGVDSGRRTANGSIIYNLPAWPWGFTTAMEVYGEHAAAVSYVCKYISKGGEKVCGRWYYHGGALQRPEVEYCHSDWDEISEGLEAVAVPALDGVELVYMQTDV